MSRPTAALCLAAVASVGIALDTGYALCPVQGEPAALSVAAPPPAIEETAASDLHTVREHPMRQACLTSPFLPEHPTRAQARGVKPVPEQIPKPGETGRETPREKAPELRLVGIAASGGDRRAIVSVGGRQLLLAPGEEKNGVTLVSLTETAAVISTSAGERTLSLPSGLTK